ncbi:GNAT family N-acetyltransferase [Nonomuraea sp. NBC_01738]|uniref:GNAT family N-acetyltransferase n=1 Tax=Nonomuraea sp. NBC_01738 TaxID=2976003 RepID=UPI002E153932|nr:GNAT family N-acetyltransferase [Nonomuraea sp. NBC_01738]
MSQVPWGGAVKPPVLLGDGLVLRGWEDTDMPVLVEVFQDEEIRRWLPAGIADEWDAWIWLQAQREGWESGERCGFAVQEAGDDGGEVLGHVVLKRPGETMNSGEVGYWTVPAARGRGVAGRALEALAAWAVPAFGLWRLELLHQVGNAASCRVAEKSGYVLERRLPPFPPDFPMEGHLHVRDEFSAPPGLHEQRDSDREEP